MILLWILAALIGLALLGTIARVIAAVLVVAIAATGALLITAVISAALGFDPSSDMGSVVGLFAISLVTILMMCRLIRREPASPFSLPTAINPVRLETDDGVNELADLRRLRGIRPTRFWQWKTARSDTATHRLNVAWSIVEAHAGNHGARIAVARRSCTRLLALQNGDLVTGSALDAVTAVRKGLPELVEAWLTHATTASPSERRQAFAEMIVSIEHVAARAERETDALDRSHAAEFAFQRAHLDRRSMEDRV